jgi:hypothetical protein
MDRPKQRIMHTARQNRPSLDTRVLPIGFSALLLLAGCAQLDQLMGRQAASNEPAPPAETAAPAPVTPTPEAHPVQATEPAPKSAEQKKTDDTRQPGTVKESHHQTPAHAPGQQTAPAEGVAKQTDPATKQPDQDKALAEKEQPKKEKKSRAASDKKKKPAKEAPLPPEDVFLSPIPLPSKPAAIGGSGG